MAKKRPTKKPQDVLPNRAYVTVTQAAATTTAVFTEVDTLMGARDGSGWLISRVDIQPKQILDGWLAAVNGVRFQVCTGQQSALLDVDDDEHILSLDLQTIFTTSGVGFFTMPFTWVGPVLVASKKLTCLIDGTDDGGPLQSMDWIFTLWYRWVKLTAQDWVDIAQLKGIA